jgi:hypothetical protein
MTDARGAGFNSRPESFAPVPAWGNCILNRRERSEHGGTMTAVSSSTWLVGLVGLRTEVLVFDPFSKLLL